MKKQKKLIIILSLAFALMLALYFAVVQPLVNREEPKEPPLSVDEGEGLYHNIRLLYDKIEREDIKTIEVHNSDGDYSFVRSDPSKRSSDFVIQEGERIYFLPEYDYEKISEIVVAVGTTYVREKIISETVTEEIFAEYGLSLADDPAYFRVETFDGESFKVYIGEKTITDGGFYMRREGVASVYVSQSTTVGNAVNAKPEYYVKPLLTRVFTTHGHYYTKDFTVWRKITDVNETLHRDDAVQFEFYEINGDGTKGELRAASMDLRDAQVAIKDAFEGKKIGDGDFSFVRKFDANYEDKTLAGRSVEYTVTRITGIDRLEICLNYLNTDERSLFQAGDIYAITDPREKRSYVPNTSMYMTVLEGIEALEGIEVVEFGLTSEKMAEYGLGEVKIYYESPEAIKSAANDNDVTISNYIMNMLYVSEKQQDGSYYAGSLLFDIIARVDGEIFDYLYEPFSSWVTDRPFSISINDVSEMKFDFGYADADETHTFLLSHTVNNKKTVLSKVTHKESSKAVNVSAFRQLFMDLLSMYYSGDYEGEKDASEIVSKKENSVLTLTVTLKNSETRTIDFCPYSERQMLVGIDGDAFFYVSTVKGEKLYNDVKLILDGKMPDYEKIY